VSDKIYEPLIVNSDGSSEQFIYGNYIYRFDGKNITGIYDKNDLGFENNLNDKIKNPETDKGKLVAKAWYQDYMDRVMNRKLR